MPCPTPCTLLPPSVSDVLKPVSLPLSESKRHVTKIHQGHRKVHVKKLQLPCSSTGTVGFVQFSETYVQRTEKKTGLVEV